MSYIFMKYVTVGISAPFPTSVTITFYLKIRLLIVFLFLKMLAKICVTVVDDSSNPHVK